MMIQILERFFRIVIAVIFLFFVSITFGQVVLRYGFSNSLPWIDELSRYSFIWLIFIASAIVARQGAHIAIDIVEELATPRVRRWLLMLADLSLIVFAAIVGIAGWRLVGINWTTLSPASGVPIAWVQLILPIFGVLMTLFAAAHLIDVWHERNRTDER
jgi:TRAP-type C4-dicarboxylate transport system permease small subunit